MSEYVRGLRERLGPDQLLLLPSVSIFIWDESGRLLMVQNAETGLWQTVGGSVEPFEHPEDAAVREAREETGLAVHLDRVRGIAGGPAFTHTYPNGDRVAFVSTGYDATVTGGQLLSEGDGDEVNAARWWRVDELAQAEMEPFTRALLTMMDIISSD